MRIYTDRLPAKAGNFFWRRECSDRAVTWRLCKRTTRNGKAYLATPTMSVARAFLNEPHARQAVASMLWETRAKLRTA